MDSMITTFGIRRLALMALMLAVFWSRTVSATVLVPADLSELVADATAIVHGRVLDVRAEWGEGRRRIDSYVTVGVATHLKGRVGDTVTFRTPGGELGAYRSVMIGAPVFRPGEEVVLFLGSRGPSIPYVLGLNQGVYRVVRDPRSGDRTVIRPAFLASGPAATPVVRGDGSRRAPTLERFAADVRALVSQQGAGRR
jgi:hypothetical protein